MTSDQFREFMSEIESIRSLIQWIAIALTGIGGLLLAKCLVKGDFNDLSKGD